MKQRLARERKEADKKAKQAAEAEKLKNMSAAEKRDAEFEQMKKELAELKAEKQSADMISTASDILKDAGKQTSVFFSTHILADVERICDRVAFLEGGKVALSGDIDEIRKKRSDTAVEVLPEKPSDAALLAEQFPSGEVRDGCFTLKNASAQDAEDLMKCILAKHISVGRFERREPDLENMFMEVIGE